MASNGPKPSLPSRKPGHYSAYWYSIRVHILRLLLSCIPLLCSDVTILTCTQKTTQRNTTRFHKNAVKGREVDQPFSICVCSQRDRLSCGVCGSWILKREQGCDVEKANRSQSPPQRHQVLQRTREETETWTLFIDTAHQAKEFQMGGITGSIVWLAKAL